jgi:hypothetical protein
MLDHLSNYAHRKSLIINVQKSKVVCFNSKGTLPVFRLNSEELANKDTCKYLACILLRRPIYTRQLLGPRNPSWLRLIGCVNLCVLML